MKMFCVLIWSRQNYEMTSVDVMATSAKEACDLAEKVWKKGQLDDGNFDTKSEVNDEWVNGEYEVCYAHEDVKDTHLKM